MYNFKQSELESLAIHFIGNKADEQGVNISKKLISTDDDITNLLKKYFLKPFKEQGLFRFHHETDLNLNEVYHYAKAIFNDPESLYLQSINIAKHLYEASSHPMIKPGELYVTYFSECIVDGEPTTAIGIFKSENKETYLKVFPSNNEYNIEKEEGININKLDKGCLIFDIKSEDGYKVAVVDNTNKGNEAVYWNQDFLNVQPLEDSYHHTKNYISMCKDFVGSAFNDADRVDQIDLVNNAVKFFDENEKFEINEFEEKVMQEPELIDSFQGYKADYQTTNDIRAVDEFEISPSAVKNSKKFINSVIKLDKNFHVYVHGNRHHIEKGYDEERDMNYYMLYFKEEM